jgi:isochorismate hydrolase
VVDAFSYNYRVVVPADATFDRWQVSHDIALFDLDAKYADVMSTEAVCEALLDHVAGLGVDG